MELHLPTGSYASIDKLFRTPGGFQLAGRLIYDYVGAGKLDFPDADSFYLAITLHIFPIDLRVPASAASGR